MKSETRFGSCFDLIQDVASETIDLGVTSPPYADAVSYGDHIPVFHGDHYADWFLPLANEIYRTLTPSGSFILNINDKINKKQRGIYVYDLVCRVVKETDLQLYDRYIWHKKSGLPTGGDKRLNDRVEYIFHFVKDVNQFKCNPDSIRIPYAPATISRAKSAPSGNKRTDSNGIAKIVGNKCRINPKGIIPPGVFRFDTNAVRRNQKFLHPAAFHPDLPEFFIKWLTDPGDLVLDPFMGSGTTAEVAEKLGRKWLGFELNRTYKELIEERINAITG